MSDSSNYIDQLVDETALEEYLSTELKPADEFEVSHHTGGNSNEIIFVIWDDLDLVLRRPPPGDTADTAHEILREYQVLSALQETPVPVPETILECTDTSVLGAEFYLMERVDGEIIGHEEPDRFATPEYRRQIGVELIETLSHVHTVDYEGVGLHDFGHPEGYTQRQVDRWSKQMEWLYTEKDHHRRISDLEELREWLGNNIPETHPHTLVHGDFRLDNMLFGTDTPPKLVAALDWELSTLGDPLADLGFLLAHWRDPKDNNEPAIPEWTSPHTEHPDYLTRQKIVSMYEDQTGIELRNERFYRALAVFKEAVAGEMFYARHLNGETDDPLYPRMEDRVPAMAARGLRIISGDDPL
jgi:aminoglycoside phosphotransferase (APT) family kinase protein